MRTKTRITKARSADDVLKVGAFLKKWPGHSLTRTDLTAVQMFAAWKGSEAQAAFTAAYAKQPELVAALLVHLTKICTGTTATAWLNLNFDSWLMLRQNGKLKCLTDLSDDELSVIFSKESKLKISTALVKKYRQERAKGTK